MAKYHGKIGYAIAKEEPANSGVWVEKIEEKESSGDVIKSTRRLQSSEYIADDITVSNEISIIADPFANGNFHSIRYATFMGVKWKVTNVEVQYPRLLLSLGGVYNE